MTSAAERLGHPSHAKLLLVSCAELGFCHASNLGVFSALRGGIGTSASLMVPAPWSREAASSYRGEDIGVRLTLNAEHDLFRWGPITQAPSLLDGDGGFPRTITDVWDHADIDEVRRECRAQVERAVLWGFDVSHLDAHLDALILRPEFFDVYLELAVDFSLPVRLPGAEHEPNVGFPFRALATDEGVLFADRSASGSMVRTRQHLIDMAASLEPGITEVTFRPAIDTTELRAVTDDWEVRVCDHAVLTQSGDLESILEDVGVTLIGFRALRDAMRRP
ncbi:MAG: ChbG/HpnK family deacetylase [Acidimicrobiales bacterium]